MNGEISQEAKQALADNARRQAFDRLKRDGAHSTAALQRRVRALAAERNIPPADIHKLMYKKPSTHSVMAFCEKHKVNFDWILCGDLQGLRRMTQERVFQPASRPIVAHLLQKYRNLPPELQKIIEQTVDRLLEKQK